jgi:hypothetical protein
MSFSQPPFCSIICFVWEECALAFAVFVWYILCRLHHGVTDLLCRHVHPAMYYGPWGADREVMDLSVKSYNCTLKRGKSRQPIGGLVFGWDCKAGRVRAMWKCRKGSVLCDGGTYLRLKRPEDEDGWCYYRGYSNPMYYTRQRWFYGLCKLLTHM